MRKFSWTLLDDGKLIKHLDFTYFKHKSFVIPQDFYNFFNIKDNKKYEDVSLFLSYQEKKYEADAKWAITKYPVIRIKWNSKLNAIIRTKFPKGKNLSPYEKTINMWMVFEKTDRNNLFKVDFTGGDALEDKKIFFEEEVARILQNPRKKKPEGSTKPKRQKTEIEQIARDPHVHAWVLKNSNWKCECCGKQAPFSKHDGNRYLEIHHIKRLADGGSDTVENAIAVCPNCHRELHYGAEKHTLVEKLLEKISRLKKE